MDLDWNTFPGSLYEFRRFFRQHFWPELDNEKEHRKTNYISIDIYKHEIYLAAKWHAKIHGFPRLKLSHGWHVFVFHSQALGAPSQRTPVCLASGA